MIEVAFILILFLGIGIFTRFYNDWTSIVMILIIIGMLVLFYLT
jgi:hypothetical protein